MRHLILSLAALGMTGALWAVTAPGCVAAAVAVGAAAGVGTVVYVNGELDTVIEADLDQAWEATEKAVKDLEFTTTESSKDALAAEHISRTAQDKKIQIRLNHETDTTTRIRIRVDTFGNEELSRAILDKIKANLEG